MNHQLLEPRTADHSHSRHAWAVRTVWCGLLGTTVVLLARYYEWVPIELDDSANVTIAEPLEPQLPPVEVTGDVATDFPASSEPVIFQGQGEPPVEVSRFGNFRDLNGPVDSVPAIAAEKWQPPGRSAIPEQMPAHNHARPVLPRPVEGHNVVASRPEQPSVTAAFATTDHAAVDFSGHALPQVPGEPLLPGESARRVQPAAGFRDSARESIVQVAGQTVADDDTTSAGPPRAAGTATAESNPAESAVPAELQQTFARIDGWIDDGQDLAAHRELSRLYWKQPDVRPLLASRLATTARRIYFSPQPHYMPAYEVQPGDLLSTIAARYHVPWEYLAKLNQADPRKIRVGQRLKVIKGPFSAAVDLKRFELTIHAHGYYVHRYPVGIGKDNSTPIGTFPVLNRLENPTYYGPNGVVIDADDPANPLGEHWIDLGDSYGIHGTINPDSIGRAASKGCIRMHNHHAAEVFKLLSTESTVVIRR